MIGHRFMLLVGIRTVTLVLAIFLVANMIFLQFFVLDDRLHIYPSPGIDPGLRELFVEDLALDGSLAEQYLNFMAKTLSGEFFMSSAVRKYVPVSDFVYDHAFATVGVLTAVLAISIATAGLYGFFACKWSNRLRGKAMFFLALLSAVSFVVPMLLLLEMLLIEVGFEALVRQSFVVSVAAASVPVTAAFVFIFEGITRRSGPIDLKKPFESSLKIASSRSFTAVMPLFLVYAITCVLFVEGVAFRADGLGMLILDAVLVMDIPVLIACMFITAVMVLTMIFVADILSIYASEAAPQRFGSNRTQSGTAVITGTASPEVPAFLSVGNLLRAVKRDRVAMVAMAVLVALIVAGLLSPLLSTVQDPESYASRELNFVMDGWLNPLPPSLTPSPYTGFTHPLGTDHRGGDVYSLLLYDSLESTGTALLIAVLSVVIGVGVSLLRATAQRLAPRRREVAGWLGWMFSDALMGILIFLAFAGVYVSRTSSTLTFVALLGFMSASFGKGQAAILLKDSPSKDCCPPLKASSISDVLHVGKYVSLFCFFSIAFVEFLFYSVEWCSIGWVDLIESGYAYGAFIRGVWWVIIPPMVMIGLAAASVFLMMDRLEKILHSWTILPNRASKRVAEREA